MPKIGAHVSVAGGLYKCFENARAIGAECIQIFGSSPRQWSVKLPGKADIEKFKSLREQSNISPIYLHAAYLVNLASGGVEIGKKSIASLASHLKIAELIGADGLIFHLGSGALEQTVSGMQEVLKQVPGKSQLIMEISSGGGAKIGHQLEELAQIFYQIKSHRVKLCFDTAHALEVGMLHYTAEEIKAFFDEWERLIGLKHLVVIHANDSKTSFGSRHDRHENIGQGQIGLAGFRNLAKEQRLQDKPWILEVPGFRDGGSDRKNIQILRKLFK